MGIAIVCSFRVPGRYRHLRTQSTAARARSGCPLTTSISVSLPSTLTTAFSSTTPCTRARLAASAQPRPRSLKQNKHFRRLANGASCCSMPSTSFSSTPVERASSPRSTSSTCSTTTPSPMPCRRSAPRSAVPRRSSWGGFSGWAVAWRSQPSTCHPTSTRLIDDAPTRPVRRTWLRGGRI